MMYQLYYGGRLDYSTTDKKDLEWYMINNACHNVKFFDVNGYSIPFNVRCIVGTKNEVKVGASLSKLVASVSICGRQYYVGKGASLLKIMKHDDRMFDEIIVTEKGKKKAKWTFSLAR